ncbi:MAG: hypothetical protein WCY01_06410 [Alkalispirochaeta sp.]
MKQRTTIVLALLVTVALTGWAAEDNHEKDLDEVIAEIRATMGLDAEDPINPATVPDDLLIILGDSVMESYVRDTEQHRWMDQMMGGGGSESLDAAHRWMGYRYLTGGYSDSGRFGMGGGMMGSGMMGPGMMGGLMTGGWGLMGNPDMMYDNIPYGSPDEVLKRRYAAGEISRRQYRRMIRELDR